MELVAARTPTALRNSRVTLTYVVYPGEGQQQRQVDYEIQVEDQDGSVEWVRAGDLVPFLDDTSTHLTLADRATLIDFMDRVRQEAELRILGGP